MFPEDLSGWLLRAATSPEDGSLRLLGWTHERGVLQGWLVCALIAPRDRRRGGADERSLITTSLGGCAHPGVCLAVRAVHRCVRGITPRRSMPGEGQRPEMEE
jgi:hypothetical protein